MTLTASGARIEIIVDKKGDPTIMPCEIPGGKCTAATAKLEALFGEVMDTQSTTEAYEEAQEVEIETKQGGG